MATVSMKGKNPKRNFMRNAYRRAVTQGNASGWSLRDSRLHGRKASDKARAYFDKNVKARTRLARNN